MSALAPLDPFVPGVARVPIAFVNAYLVGEPGGPWALVDTGLPWTAALVREAAEERFGPGARPEAVVLTHGHFDHAGNALELAEAWDVPIVAHPLELPYLTGRSDYAPQDPTIPGAISFLSRFFPTSGYRFGGRVRALPEDGSVPGLDGWRWLHTPGHTAGHVSLFREADRLLLAGDAVATMDLDSWAAQVVKRRELNRPPAPFTSDWAAARASVRALADLEPTRIAAGHGLPIEDAAALRLRAYAGSVEVPTEHRYGRAPAVADESGIVSLPPPVADPLPLRLAAGLGAAALIRTAARRRSRRDR